MSRICVKNLPKYVAEDKLRAHFSQKGEITDAKLMRTQDGKSRQFAFIGFRTEQEAQEAIKYFDRSYFDTYRIACELARNVGDPDIPRPWSRHSLKKEKNPEDGKKIAFAKSSSMQANNGEGKDSKKDSGIEDPQLQEFLQVMQPRAKSKLWADDTLISTAVDQNAKVRENKNQRKKLDGEKLVHDHVQVGEPDEEENGSRKEPKYIAQDAISDMDYFKSRVKKDWSDSDSGDDRGSDDEVTNDNNDYSQGSQEGQKVVVKEQDVDQEDVERKGLEGSDGEVLDPGNPSSSSKDENEVLETGRLFVRNLAYTTNEDELEELFSKFGNVSQVHLVVDKATKRSKGIAYVLFSIPECAARALEHLDNSIFQGRLLHVLPAKPKYVTEKQETNLNQASKGFKQQREEERKASEASGNTRAWNSLFMRSDTVVENIARKYGVTKSDFLDREADDLAVRIALGETQVIAETKKNLANAGVNVACLEEFAAGKADGVKRSSHVLLVKNLPYSSSEKELANMFRKFGSLDKIIIPPTKTLAVVVFLEPSEARAAFRGLAYKRYKDAPLYLEWAPSNIMCPSPKSESDNKNQSVGGGDAKRVILEQRVEGIMDEDADPDRIESRSLFVKNINFKSSDESLKKHFSEHIKEGKILSVKIKKHVKNGKTVSMGFGFIEFDSVETAMNVCKEFQGSVLDGHALILQICHAKKDEQGPKKAEDGKSSTKILVKNVAFEANEKDLRQLFSPFGQLKSLRLPRKFGNHRGFAFVEYVTKQEAKNALEALSNTHLYGRHLVLERAKEGESLEELRARTAAQFTDENGTQGPKLSKKRKQMAVLDEGTMKFQRITE